MRGLTAKGIVEAWGRGRPVPPAQRPLALLSVAFPQATAQELTELGLGERDMLLLELRRQTFGRTLKSHAPCSCGATLHFELDADEILAEGRAGEKGTQGRLSGEGIEVRFRAPTTRDLAAAARCRSVEEGSALLLARCVLDARTEDRSLAPSELPALLVEAIGERIEAMEPLIEVPVNLHCSICDRETSVYFEIGEYVWQEVAAAAERLAYDVYRLARSYGWSETDILAMGAVRRQYYLEMAAR